MNLYDFDGTIYPSNCTVEFFLWCMNRHPKLMFTFLPKMVKCFTLNRLGKMPAYLMYRKFLGFLGMIDDVEEQIERYWDKNEKKIASWYLAQKKDDDLIISASPTCIINPIAKRLGVKCVATEYNIKYGVFMHNFMHAKEKSLYIMEHGFPVIDNFYSDSLSDTPIALCAEKAHLVSNRATKVSDWPKLDSKTMKKVNKKIDTGWNIHLND